MLTIPIRHVHAPGKCNRAMLDALRKHRGAGADDTDDEDVEDVRDQACSEAEADMNED